MVTEVSILGSTGSIGTQTIDVCQKHNIKVIGISANENIDLLTKQALSLNPKYVCICNEDKYKLLKENLKGTKIQVLTGIDGLLKVASCAKTTVNALVGISGLQPTIYAIKNKINVALANKETLVVGGKLITSLAKENNVSILPVDSEHSAIFQCLQGGTKAVKQIILTASGGPFYKQTDLSNVTLSQALKHPNWNMGAKVTIDSATLMNKGLEYIEAYWLFNQVPIKIVVHPQSIVHSMIEYQDNSVIAQMGSPDMRLPIQYALTYPDRLPCDAPQLNLVGKTLTFDNPDYQTFPCLKLAIDAIAKGGLYPTILNAANEIAVSLFLQEKITFMQISKLVNDALTNINLDNIEYNYDNIIKVDNMARQYVLERR